MRTVLSLNANCGCWIRSLGANGVRQYSLVKEHGWFGNPVLQVKEPLSIDNRYESAGTVCNIMVFDWRLCQNSLCHNTPTKKLASKRSLMDFGGKCAALPWSWLGDLHRVCVCILLAGCCRMDVGYSKKSSLKWAPKRLNIGSLHRV